MVTLKYIQPVVLPGSIFHGPRGDEGRRTVFLPHAACMYVCELLHIGRPHGRIRVTWELVSHAQSDMQSWPSQLVRFGAVQRNRKRYFRVLVLRVAVMSVTLTLCHEWAGFKACISAQLLWHMVRLSDKAE
jgi:hypothetical protein